MVRVGVRFDPGGGGRGPERDAARLSGLVEAGARAEALGLDVVWVGERPLGPTALVASALSLLAAVAVRTGRVRLATAVLPLPAHHPLRLAEEAATVDGLSGGRLELGLGLGEDPAALTEGLGPERDAHAAALESRIAGLRQAFVAADASRVEPPPVQPGGPPLWLGARSAAGQRRAARLGLGLLLEGGAADPGPYLAGLRETGTYGGPASPVRVALLLDPRTDAADAAARARRALAEGAERVDLVASARSGEETSALARAASWREALGTEAGARDAASSHASPARARDQSPGPSGR